MIFKWTVHSWAPLRRRGLFPHNHWSQPCKTSRGKASRSLLFVTRPVSLRQQPASNVLAFLHTIVLLFSPYPHGLHGGWLFPMRSSFMISWVTTFSLYLFDSRSHFLFGNFWGFNGGGTCPALLPSLSIQPCSLCHRFWLRLSHWHWDRGREGPSLLGAAQPAIEDFTWEPDGGAAGPHPLWGRHCWGWWMDVGAWALGLFSGSLL